MDSDVVNYIDCKFKELNSSMWKFSAILVTILLTFAGSIAYNTKASIENKHAIETLKTQQEKLLYVVTWTAEVSETQRDFFKAIMKNDDVSKFLDKLDDIQKRIDGIEARPTFRGSESQSIENDFKHK